MGACNIFEVSSQLLFSQLLLGLINGAFYAMLSLGLAVIFGMLNVINFTHGAQYMMGAFAAWLMLTELDIPFWFALILSPIVVGLFGIVIERLLLQWLYKLDHLYGLLLTFGLALIIEGVFRNYFGSAGLPYRARSGMLIRPALPTFCEPSVTNSGFWWMADPRAASWLRARTL